MSPAHYSKSRLSSKWNIPIPIIYVVLLVLIAIAFYPSLDNQFLYWDDQYYVTQNIYITQPTFDSLASLMRSIVSANYHPITMISLWINALFSGVDHARPFILTNLLFHFCNSVLVFKFVQKLFPKKEFMSWVCAIFFAIHPMHVPSVIWVSERKDVLYVFFFLLSAISYINFLKTREIKNYILSFFLFLASCLSKAMAVSLVPVLFLLEWKSIASPNLKKSFFRISPFAVIGLFIGLIAMDVQSGGNFYGTFLTMEHVDALDNARIVGLSDKVKNVIIALSFYTFNFFIPHDMAAFHPYDGVISQSTNGVLFFMGFLIASIVSLFSKHRRVVLFGWFFFLSTILLVLQVIPVGNALVADRYTYLPYVGLSIVLAAYLNDLPRLMKYGILGFCTMAFCFITNKQSDQWQNHTTLFTQVVNKYPQDAISRKFLVSGYWYDGQLDRSIFHLRYAIDSLGQESSSMFDVLANSYADNGQHELALYYYDRAVDADSSNWIARYHRAILLIDSELGFVRKELDIIEKSGNKYVEPLIYAPRGRVNGLLGNYNKAIADLKKAIYYDPKNPDNYYDLGVTHELQKDTSAAITCYQQVIQLKPDYQSAIERLSILNSLGN